MGAAPDPGRHPSTTADGALDPADAALVAALEAPLPAEGDEAHLTLAELAERSGLSLVLLETLAREGLLLPRVPGDPPRYTLADADAVRAGAALLEAGLPLGELLALAREYDHAMRAVATHAVDLFVRFVRDPVHGSSVDDDEAAERLVGAFRTMLPATASLVGHHVERLLLTAARERFAAEVGDAGEGRTRT